MRTPFYCRFIFVYRLYDRLSGELIMRVSISFERFSGGRDGLVFVCPPWDGAINRYWWCVGLITWTRLLKAGFDQFTTHSLSEGDLRGKQIMRSMILFLRDSKNWSNLVLLAGRVFGRLLDTLFWIDLSFDPFPQILATRSRFNHLKLFTLHRLWMVEQLCT